MRRIIPYLYVIVILIIVISVTANFPLVYAEDTPAETNTSEATDQQQKDLEALQKTIDAKNAEMQKLDEEIAKYKKQIEQTGQETTSLKATLKNLENVKAKLSADIKLTQKKIEVTNLNINKLGIDISAKKNKISESVRTIQSAIKIVNEIDTKTPAEILLANERFYDGWNDFENLLKFQGSVTEELENLKVLKQQLENTKTATEKEKKNLTSLKSQLSGQQQIIAQNQKEKNQLLTDTKNKESEYRKVLADRLAKKEKLEQEILDFESQLKATVDTSLIPKTGAGILAYPLDKIRITQYFGNTPFSTKNPQVYNGMGHNGVDFGTPVGTPIKSAGDGIVTDTGNTDTSCYGVSYGKWVLIRHLNGLSTLYAHLSVISVAPGDGVEKGYVIGYSGNTGYSTGPHLHFTVYASQGVHVSGPTEYKSKVCKTYLKLPLAPRNAYLNPMSYL